MSIVERLLGRRPPGPDWTEACAAGAPLPSHRCSAVDCDSVPLRTLAVGASAVVSCLEQPASAEAAKLATLGVLPGVELRLLQRYPAWVLCLGHAELALDDRLAAQVRVLGAGAPSERTGGDAARARFPHIGR